MNIAPDFQLTERESRIVLVGSEAQADLSVELESAEVLSFQAFMIRAWLSERAGMAPASPSLIRLCLRRILETVDPASLGFVSRDGERIARGHLVTHADELLAVVLETGLDTRELVATKTTFGVALAGLLDALTAALDRLRAVDVRRASRELLRDDPDPPWLRRVASVEVRGVASLTPSEISLLGRIHASMKRRGAEGVRIHLPLPWLPNLKSALADRIERAFAESEDAPEIAWERAEAPSFTLVKASGARAIARRAARSVVDACRAGIPLDRIVVLVAPRIDVLEVSEMLREAGIVAAIDVGAGVDDIPSARATLSLLGERAEVLARETVLAICQAPGLFLGSVFGTSDETIAATRGLRFSHRVRRLPTAAFRDGEGLVRSLEKEGGAHEPWLVEAAQIFWRIAKSFHEATDPARLHRAVQSFVALTRGATPSALRVGAALGYARVPSRAVLAAMAESARAMQAIEDATRSLDEAAVLAARLPGEVPLEAHDLAIEIDAALGRFRATVTGSAARGGAVRITRPNRAIGSGFHTAIVCGLGRRSFESETAPWFDETTRRQLPPDRRPASTDELRLSSRAGLDAILGEVSTAVLIEDDEAAASPHPVATFARARGASEEREPSSRVHPEASTVSATGLALSMLAAGGPVPRDLVVPRAVEIERSTFFADLSRPGGAYSGAIPDGQVLSALLGGAQPNRALSVSAVDVANRCRFRSFATRVLRARPFEERSEIVSPRERGDMVHKAIHLAFEVARRERHRSDEEILLRAEAAARAVVMVDAPPLLLESARIAVEDAMRVLAAELATSRLAGYAFAEKKFAHTEEPPFGPIEIRKGDEALYIEGQIDRIDIESGVALIIDYKTGGVPTRAAWGETALQLPLYGIIGERLGQSVGGMFVRIPASGTPKAVPLREKDRAIDATLLRRAEERAIDAVVAMRRGNVEPRPLNKSECTRCDVRDLCRRPMIVPEDTKSGAESASAADGG